MAIESNSATKKCIAGGTGCKLPEQSCLLPPASHVVDRDTTSRI